MRQSSRVIGTDTTGSAVMTINTILTGITNSVNRLSQLNASMERVDPKITMQEHVNKCSIEQGIIENILFLIVVYTAISYIKYVGCIIILDNQS